MVLVAVGTLVAACGGTTSPGVANLGSTTSMAAAPASATPAPFGGVQQQYQYAVSYAECMRSHGDSNFPVPAPPSKHGFAFNPDADSHSPQFASAHRACKHLLPNNGGLPTASQSAAETAKLLQYAKCMRSHGEPNFPDPTVKSDQFGFSLNGIDPNSPQYQAAQKACQSLLPGGL